MLKASGFAARCAVRVAAVAAFVFAACLCDGGQARAGDACELRYKFEEGAEAVYDLAIELDISTTAGQETQKQESFARTELGISMNVVEHAPADEAPATLDVTFDDLKLDQTLDGPAGKVSLAIDEGEVKHERDGVEVIDTKAGKGKDKAGLFLREFAFIGEKGTLTVKPNGRVSAVDGPPEFMAFLRADTPAGLWPLETTKRGLRPGDTWKSVERTINRLRGLDISANRVIVRLGYTLTAIEERDGRKIAIVAVKSETIERDLSGRLSGESIRSPMSITIPRFERRAEGTVEFDVERGRGVASDIKVTLKVDTEMKIGEGDDAETVGMKTTGTARVRVKLVPPAPETDEPAAEAPTDAPVE